MHRRGAAAVTDTYARASRILLALGCSPEGIRGMVIPGPPISKGRPKADWKHKRLYDPTVKEETELAKMLMGFRGRPWRGNIGVVVIFYRPDRLRLDTDNMQKFVLDAGTRARLWLDDSQVTAIAAITELDKEDPRTVMVIGQHASTLERDPPPKPKRT